MNRKKAIAVSIVLVLILLIGRMLAYFTDTDEKTNVFTIGEGVDIEITETFAEGAGLNVLPGQVIEKIPAIQNNSTTTAAYVFMTVTLPCYASDPTGDVDTPLFMYTPNSGWLLIDEDMNADDTITRVYAYATGSTMTTLAKSDPEPADKTKTAALFNSVRVVPTLTTAQSATAPASPNIVIKAYAIQTEGITGTPLDIFNAHFAN